jgi:phage terminase large subunit GpA-like protein
MNSIEQLIEIFEDTRSRRMLSTLKPSEWAERNRMMTSAESPWPGPFSFSRSPYMREIVDRLSPNDPAIKIAVMCGSQIGKSVNIIENGICWIISENPGNILFLTGHSDLSDEAIQKLDLAIDNCGLRSLIRPTVVRAKNGRTGDTNKAKEFPGGTLVSGSASNHKLLRQRSVRFIFADDLVAAKKMSKASGSTRKLIEQRAFAYGDKSKQFYISTPETLENSNIMPAFQAGDQRYYHVPCPCCGEMIHLQWSVAVEGTEGNEMGGIVWELDGKGKLLPESVAYRCQKCGDLFDETHKTDIFQAGEWVPSAEPMEIGFYSYQISTIYAPAGAYGWVTLVADWLEAHPQGEKPKQDLLQTFMNLKMGLPYEKHGESPEAKLLQHNIRNYDIGVIPEKLSMADGNGKIVILTCACDCNGTEDDARLDWEVLAWAEKDGVSYSIAHGSIGTFIPLEGRQKVKADREHWTYKHHGKRSVWRELDQILETIYMTDSPNPTPEDRQRVGRKMKIALTGVDTGHYTQLVYDFIDSTNSNVVGVRGDKESKFRKYDADTASFKEAKERGKLYLIDVNYVKDTLAEWMKLKWVTGNDPEQPRGFMNFPVPARGLYLLNNYFSHYESEHKVPSEAPNGEISYRWVKKGSSLQNHHFDIRVYGMALRDIIVEMVGRELKIKKATWADFCTFIMPK